MSEEKIDIGWEERLEYSGKASPVSAMTVICTRKVLTRLLGSIIRL